MRSIGQSLTEDGDILFYGCNVTSTEGGKTLISKISEVTKADIAASDDVTGKSGDWKLESKFGNIETKNISQVNYIHDLAMTRTESIPKCVDDSCGTTINSHHTSLRVRC